MPVLIENMEKLYMTETDGAGLDRDGVSIVQ